MVPGNRARHSLPLASAVKVALRPLRGTGRLRVTGDWPTADPRNDMSPTQPLIGWCAPSGNVVGAPLTLSPPPTMLWERTCVPRSDEPAASQPKLVSHGLPAAHPHRLACAGAPGWSTATRPVGSWSAWSPGSPPKSDCSTHASAATAPPRATPRRPGGTRLSRWATLLPPYAPLPPPHRPPRPHHSVPMGTRPPGACHAWLLGGAHGPCRRRR